jgi:hypothetical protein
MLRGQSNSRARVDPRRTRSVAVECLRNLIADDREVIDEERRLICEECPRVPPATEAVFVFGWTRMLGPPRDNISHGTTAANWSPAKASWYIGLVCGPTSRLFVASGPRRD